MKKITIYFVTLMVFFVFILIIANTRQAYGVLADYRWSNDIDCPGAFNGSYQVCQIEGYQNTCTVPGARTCDCGSSTWNNNDGNCD